MVTAGPSPRPRDAPAWPKHRPRGARGNRLRHGGFFLGQFKGRDLSPMRSMYVYIPAKLGDFVWANVGKYSSTMGHMGIDIQWQFQAISRF